MAELHDRGEELLQKQGLEGNFEVGLYNTSDNLADSDDLSSVTTEPSGSNYSRVSVNFTSRDVAGNWEINNDSDVVVDTSDSSETVDGYIIVANFQSEDAGDSSAQDHLIASGDLPKSVNLDDGTNNVTNVNLQAENVGISLDETIIFQGFESGSLPDTFDNNYGSIETTSYEGTYSIGVETRRDKSTRNWSWEINELADGAANIQRLSFAHRQNWDTAFQNDSNGEAFDFEDSNGNLILRLVHEGRGGTNLYIRDADGTRFIASPGFYNKNEWILAEVTFNWTEGYYRVIWQDGDGSSTVEVPPTNALIVNNPVQQFTDYSWNSVNNLADGIDEHNVDNMEVYLS